MPLTLTVNGAPQTLPGPPATIQALLAHLKVPPGRVAVEVNAQVVKKADHPTHLLNEGDQVEIVAFVGGG
jgi:thiamine biosynthesis protein ThiS